MTKEKNKLNFVFLSDDFYKDYDKNTYKEILEKDARPYIMFIVKIDNIDYAVPFRTEMKHPYGYFTNPPEICGIDYSKAVVITKEEYIDSSKEIRVSEDEFKNIKGNEYKIIKGFKNYLKKYKKATKELSVPRNKKLCEFSALQYFHKEMGIKEITLEPTL